MLKKQTITKVIKKANELRPIPRDLGTSTFLMPIYHELVIRITNRFLYTAKIL